MPISSDYYFSMDRESIIFDDGSFEADMARIALPVLSDACTDGYTPQGLFYSVYRTAEPKGVVTVSHGFSEGMHKYRELVYLLLKSGYSTVIFEHRGHGRSVRQIDDSRTVHIDTFETYVEDLLYITKEIALKEAAGRPMYLFGHSMGGCIATLFQEAYPSYYRKLILSSPMLGINMAEGIKAPLAGLLAGIVLKAGKGRDRVPGMGEEQETFETSLATSEERWRYCMRIREANILLQTSAPTFGWAAAALKASKKAMKEQNKITVPTLLFQAENETMVSNKAEDRFAEANSNVQLVRVAGSRHEILLSPKAVLAGYMNKLLEFIN